MVTFLDRKRRCSSMSVPWSWHCFGCDEKVSGFTSREEAGAGLAKHRESCNASTE